MMNKKQLIKNLLAVQFEMGYLSGKWAENEYNHENVAEDEILYMTGIIIKTYFPDFKYEYKPEEFEPYRDEYDDCILTLEEYDNIIYRRQYVTEENYMIVDAIASDILEKIKVHVFKKLFPNSG